MTGSPGNSYEESAKDRQYVALAWTRLDDIGWRTVWLAAASNGFGFQYVIFQNVESYSFTTYLPSLDPCGFIEGQAFGPRGELHWRRDHWIDEQAHEQTGWQVLFVGEQSAAPADPPAHWQLDLSEKEWHVRGVTVPLRGRRLSGQSAWFEPRIPHPLEYPWSGQEEILALSVMEFERAGKVEFVQLCELKAWKPEGAK